MYLKFIRFQLMNYKKYAEFIFFDKLIVFQSVYLAQISEVPSKIDSESSIFSLPKSKSAVNKA